MRPPAACTASVTRRQPRTSSGIQSPGVSAQPKAVGLIAVASATIRPADARCAVLGLKFGRYMVNRACPHAGQRRHHNAVGQIEIAHAYRREMSVNSLTRFMKSIISIPDDSSISKLCIALPGTS